jgi:hypothetical protein
MASNIQPITFAAAIGAWEDAFLYNFPEGATQAFPLGAPLKASSGTLIVVSSVTAPTIAGIAANKATGTTGTAIAPNCWVYVPLASAIFQVSVDTTTTNNTAALGTGTPSVFTLLTNYQMLLDSTSGNYYMGTGTSNAVFQLLSYDPSQSAVINGRVNVRILTSQTIYS